MFFEKFKSPLSLTTCGIRLPEFRLSDEDRLRLNIPQNASNLEILRELCISGYKKRISDGSIPKERAKEYGERVTKELNILSKTNFVDYILIIYDLIAYRDRKGLAKSYGRGSCAGSLICHLLGITNCDPIKNELFFERFISESRAKTNIVDGVVYLSGTLPDVDIDLADEERHELVSYLMNKYPNRVVKLSTISTYATKSLVGDLCKIFFGWEKEEYEFLTKQVVAKFGKNPTPEEVRKESKIFNDFCNKNPLFTDCLYKLHECNKGNSSHASAYFVSYETLDKVMPIQMGKILNEDGEEEGEIEKISGYDMYTSESLGIKVDLLGVKSLTMVNEIAKQCQEDIYNLDFDNYKEIYSHLENLTHPHGLFQISGHAAIKGLNKIKPKNLEELSVVSAICRPGAMEFIDDYAEYTNHGTKKSLHPFFDEILDKTAGKAIFQETLMSMFNKIGFSLEECETLRRAIGKKDASKLPPLIEKAYKLASENNIPEEAVKIAIDLAEKSASYSFNKSHAVSYSQLTAATVYLKWKYPLLFFLFALRKATKESSKIFKKDINEIIVELPYFGIKLLPPDLVKSQMDFTIEDNNIRYGLSSIKGIKKINKIQSIEKLKHFIDDKTINKFQLFNLAKESGLNVAIMCALIQSGCLDSLGEDRALNTLEIKIWNKLTPREQNYCIANGHKYNYRLVDALKSYLSWDDGKPFRESRLETIRKHTKPLMEIFKHNKAYPLFTAFEYESELLGFSYSSSLKEIFLPEHKDIITISESKNLDKGNKVAIVARVIKSKRSVSKNGNDMLFMEVGDNTGTIVVRMMRENLANYARFSQIPQENDIVIIRGEYGEDVVWCDRLSIHEYKLAFKISDIKSKSDEVLLDN